MALPRTLGALSALRPRALRPALRRAPARGLAGELRSTCDHKPRPPCPPCEPKPRPPCREPPSDRIKALRVTCCPPPRGCRPPCEPPPPACALTCEHAAPPEPDAAACAPPDPASCGDAQDRVALRLAAAARARQADYEHEARARVPPVRAEPEPYRLEGERACARATDGRNYALATPAAAPAAPQGCGPCRTPPPPRCVEFRPDDKCQPRSKYLDPCAHRPRIILEIDRSAPAVNPACPPDGAARPPPAAACRAAKPPPAAACRAAKPPPVAACRSAEKAPSGEGLTSRIMKSLNLGRGGAAATCPRRPCDAQCGEKAQGAARRAGDTSWCAAPPRAPNLPPKCREPSLTDRLRRGRGCGPHRRLHTSAPAAAAPKEKTAKVTAAQTEENSRRLAAALDERSRLKEAAQGRAVGPAGAGGARKRRPSPPGGRLELSVPPGASTVKVRVKLEGADGGPCAPPIAPSAPPLAPCAPAALSVGAARTLSSSADPPESWLSLKSLQRKFTGCRKTDEVAKKKSGPVCPPPRGPPCGAPKSTPTKSPSPNPCAPPPKSKPCAPPPKSKPCAPKPKAPPPSKPCGPPPPKPCGAKSKPPATKTCGAPSTRPFTPPPAPRSPCDTKKSSPKKETRCTSAMELLPHTICQTII